MLEVVKNLGVAWVGALSFVFAFLVSRILDNFTPELKKEQAKWMTFLEVVVQFSIISVIVYMSRRFIKRIPFPLEGVAGYIHSNLSELRSLPLVVFIIMFFQTKTQEKMKALYT